jgi:DnaJ-class molecular chaperone
MPSMDCPNCAGTGYEEDASGEDAICTMCDGTGVLLTDEAAGAADSEHWAGFA